jgi:hypothetical protein
MVESGKHEKLWVSAALQWQREGEKVTDFISP